MKPTDPRDSDSRRDFFKKTALLGAAALLGRKARSVSADETVSAPLPRIQGRYRMTAHIRTRFFLTVRV